MNVNGIDPRVREMQLFHMLQDLCPKECEVAVSRKWNELRLLEHREMMIRMAGLLYDGLVYGNWPGVEY